jgi:hypothetical protein
MRRKITNETWEQIRTAYVAGIGLREIARKMDIPAGTILAHASSGLSHSLWTERQYDRKTFCIIDHRALWRPSLPPFDGRHPLVAAVPI